MYITKISKTIPGDQQNNEWITAYQQMDISKVILIEQWMVIGREIDDQSFIPD